MKLYDKTIEEALRLLEGFQGRPLKLEKNSWEDAGKYNLILKSEMAYELGGGTLPAISGLGFTSDEGLAGDNEVLLYGPDLNELTEDSPFARFTILSVSEEGLGEGDKVYSTMKNIEYTRYHIHPEGYMMRVSTATGREPVRISRDAVSRGLNFSKVGSLFIDGYIKHPEIKSVKLIFVTEPNFPYKEFKKLTEKSEAITESLNHIFNNLQMDCGTCGFKPVCDEVEGMREMHMNTAKIL